MLRDTFDGLHLGLGGRGDGPLIVFVHGTMDRGAAFLRVTRLLPDQRWCVYDRRGYGRSPVDAPPSFDDHVADLVSLLERFAHETSVVLVGHSLGGTLALAAASRRAAVVASLLVYEAPLPWLPWWPSRDAEGTRLEDQEPEVAVERFMGRVIGIEAWESLPSATRAHKVREGAMLIAELVSVRSGPPFDRAEVRAPCLVARGSHADPIRVRAAEWLVEGLPTAELRIIHDAPHVAHASHPGEFATLVVEAIDRAEGAAGA